MVRIHQSTYLDHFNKFNLHNPKFIGKTWWDLNTANTNFFLYCNAPENNFSYHGYGIWKFAVNYLTMYVYIWKPVHFIQRITFVCSLTIVSYIALAWINQLFVFNQAISSNFDRYLNLLEITMIWNIVAVSVAIIRYAIGFNKTLWIYRGKGSWSCEASSYQYCGCCTCTSTGGKIKITALCRMWSQSVNTLRPRRDRRHFADDTFKCVFLNENERISLRISLKFVPKGPINNNPALIQIMAWRRPGDKPLSESMLVRLSTHICVTRPQRVNYMRPQLASS